MRLKAIFSVGFAAGYVVGAKAGRQRYDAIMRAARGFAEHPAVQETAGVLQAQASEMLATVRRAAGGATSTAVDSAAYSVAARVKQATVKPVSVKQAKVKQTVGQRSASASAPTSSPGSANGTQPQN